MDMDINSKWHNVIIIGVRFAATDLTNKGPVSFVHTLMRHFCTLHFALFIFISCIIHVIVHM